MYEHLVLKRDAPAEYMEYLLIEKFGWTISQIRAEKVTDILRILNMMDVIGTVQKKRSKRRGR